MARHFRLLCASLLALAAIPGAAETCGAGDGKRVFWGDLHVHTAFSLDAYVAAATRTPEDAYRFARGEPDRLADGSEVRIDRPLDFLAVTDHAEYFGVAQLCGQLDTDIAYCRELNEAVETDGVRAFREFFLPPLMANERICPEGADRCRNDARDLWDRVQRAAHEAYEPCEFTTFVGNEWTLSPENLHWHRNLIYRGEVVPRDAINVLDEPTVADMLRALERRCRPEEGCEALAIPHNMNLGMGGSLATTGQDAATLELRARFERLAEIFQHKGASECWPGGPFTDEACDFEIALPVRAGQSVTAGAPVYSEAEQAEIAAGYVRPALAEGLGQQAASGLNPLRLGFVGATDSHGARPGYVTEPGWRGTFSGLDDTPESRSRLATFNPGGLTGVWATENTREAIFDALARREVYATSGPRIRLRFAQTRSLEVAACAGWGADVAVMGGTLAPVEAPRFVVHAAMDATPIAAIDIVRLRWENGAATQHVETFTSDGRADWCLTWTDPDHDARLPTLWYARVREAPTPRWSVELGDETMIEERAWSSPIFSFPDPFER